MKIVEVVNKSQLKKFIHFPFDLYKGNPFWVPPLVYDEYLTLQKDKNPAFNHCIAKYWLVINNEKIVGRIAGIINQLEFKKTGIRKARFGWFDVIDDIEVTELLFDKLEYWAKLNECTEIHGPMGFSDLDREGMLVEGFEELGRLATNYNYEYYPKYVSQIGYKKKIDWLEFEVETPSQIPEKLERYSDCIKRRYNVREVKLHTRKDVKSYAKDMFRILNATYQNLYGFTSLTEKQINDYIKQYLGITVPNFISILVDKNNRSIAFGITMPSFSKALQKSDGKLFPFGFFHLFKALRRNDLADGYLIGILPEYQNKGLHTIMINTVFKNHIKYGIKKFESGIHLETNHKATALWKFFEHRQHKRRRCFSKEI